MSTAQLNSQQLAHLAELSAVCKIADGNIIPFYPHMLSQTRAVPCNILFYQQQTLVGFLSAFFFYQDACEVSVMVAPAYRKQGIATQMLTEILPHLSLEQINSLIFSTTPAFSLDNNYLPSHGFLYQSSEYEMRRDSFTPVTAVNLALQIRPACLDDMPTLCALDLACFPDQAADMEWRFRTLLNDPAYGLFVASYQGRLLGKAHIQWLEDSARFADIAIIPAMQNRGFGSALLSHCVNHALSLHKSNLLLEVATNNQNALNLYTKLGFTISNVCDYWVIARKALYSLLQFA